MLPQDRLFSAATVNPRDELPVFVFSLSTFGHRLAPTLLFVVELLY